MIKKFLGQTDGNMAMMAAILLLPALGVAGLAIDYTRAENMREHLQGATDAAALAAAALPDGTTNRERIAIAHRFASENGAQFEISQREVRAQTRIRSHEVVVNGTITLRNTFPMGLYQEATVVQTTSVARRASKPVEIVFVIDETNSMTYGSSWPNARRVMEDALADMEAAASPGNLTVGVVPFTDRVNIGTGGSQENWLVTASQPAGWNGCVEPREVPRPGFPYALDISAPDNSFAPTHAGYAGGIWVARAPRQCATEILQPTRSLADVGAKFDDVATKGDATGRFDQGLAFAWRMLTPSWRGKWSLASHPADIGDADKKVVLITDGFSNIARYEFDQRDSWGFNEGSEVMFEHIVELCDRMKAESIQITVVHLDGNMQAIPYLRSCASSGQYFPVSNAGDFNLAIGSLNNGTGQVRLVR